MKKLYDSPELELVKLNLLDSLMDVSKDENYASGGDIEDPDSDMVE